MSNSLCVFDFQNLSCSMLNTLVSMIDNADIDGILECENFDGVVNISDGKGNVYIVSRHEPSMQIWIASPISGSVRFSYDKSLGIWINSNNNELFNFLRSEINMLFNIMI
ncbi:iron donor protein CyaY [Ehrlichia ruminantium]|uniref:Iron donor protein CyaY n=1 Tax=Ehrlichia ruminantium TaxID=779 RepID=A0AAE6QAH5_EHRRU|nr:iron donor protein CyaY [Ehrlichia ruminantium]QGR02740.1 iron donor protein CyaY [Ehrlichia ruminantium]QGR03660.1 iron donor protein CyaY [Ehrlichia ruminantium]QGR04587.1 iron donor protein CyaY [Ehrlichia ruminantium]